MPDPRVPPHDVPAEEALLGSVLMSNQALGDVIGVLSSADFYKPLHGETFAAIERLWRRGEPCDAVTVSGELREQQTEFEEGWLIQLQAVTPAISRAVFYADRIIRASRLRSVIGAAAEMLDLAYQPGVDPDDVHTLVSSFANDSRLLPRRIDVPEDLMILGDYLEAFYKRNLGDDEEVIVPGMLKKRWRALFVAAEGSGKSLLLRQIATMIANGFHPFVGPTFRVKPRRVLMVDAENPSDVIAEQSELLNTLSRLELSASENLWIWHVQGGLNLRSRKDQARLEAAIQKVRPEVVTMGPIYKLYSNGTTDLEQSATEFVTFLDGLRSRFGFALLMEHHAPKGVGGSRDLVPFGSVVWQRWPEFGFKLVKMGDADGGGHPMKLGLRRFRGDRVIAQWPKELERGTKLNGVPWLGKWDDGTWSTGRTEPDADEEPF